MNKKTWPFLFILVLAVLAAWPSTAMAGRSVRVLLFKDIKGLTIERAGRTFVIGRADGSAGALVNKRPRRLPLEFRAPRGEFIYIDRRPYRGVLRLYASPGGGLMVVDELDMEEYLAGIINYEISSAWPVEAVKAQAVAARTYVLYRMERAGPGPYDIEGSTAGQVYRGAASEDEAATRAVRACSGEALFFDGHPALTVFHSNAGGHTDAADDIWSGGESYPYLKSVKSPYDRASPRYRWDFAVPAPMLGRVLRAEGYEIGDPVEAAVEDHTPGGRIRKLRIRDRRGRSAELRGEDIRRIIGYSIMRSSVFTVRASQGLFIFTGRGSGHGVGMSQWGARGMAGAGYSYREILRHYYPGTRLKKVF